MIWKFIDNCLERVARASHPKSLQIKNRILEEWKTYPPETWRTEHCYGGDFFYLHHPDPKMGWVLVVGGFIRNGMAPTHLEHEMCFRDKRELYKRYIGPIRDKFRKGQMDKVEMFINGGREKVFEEKLKKDLQ